LAKEYRESYTTDDIKRRIDYLKNRIDFAESKYEKLYFMELLRQEETKSNQVEEDETKADRTAMITKTDLTLEQLTQYDGSGGKPAYVAVDGIIYDVSREGSWGGGTHFGLYAGQDLTEQFSGCHQAGILKNLPIVGRLIK